MKQLSEIIRGGILCGLFLWRQGFMRGTLTSPPPPSPYLLTPVQYWISAPRYGIKHQMGFADSLSGVRAVCHPLVCTAVGRYNHYKPFCTLVTWVCNSD